MPCLFLPAAYSANGTVALHPWYLVSFMLPSSSFDTLPCATAQKKPVQQSSLFSGFSGHGFVNETKSESGHDYTKMALTEYVSGVSSFVTRLAEHSFNSHLVTRLFDEARDTLFL